MAQLTLGEFLSTYPADREFTPSLGPSTTVGAFFDRLSAEEKAIPVTYRGNEEGVFVFLNGLESARLGRVSWPPSPFMPTEPPTEPTAPTAGTVHIPAPMQWAMGFSAKLDNVEAHDHAYQCAIDAQRKYRGTDEEKKTELRARAQELGPLYQAARTELFDWVVAHPAPEGTAELS